MVCNDVELTTRLGESNEDNHPEKKRDGYVRLGRSGSEYNMQSALHAAWNGMGLKFSGNFLVLQESNATSLPSASFRSHGGEDYRGLVIFGDGEIGGAQVCYCIDIFGKKLAQ